MAEIGRGFAVIGYDDSEVREGMKRTGSALKGEMKSASSAASGELRRLQAAAAAAGTKATQTAARLSKATSAEANALGKLRVAQAQVNDVKAKGASGSAALVRAEEALAKAQRDAETATQEKTRALKADEVAQRRAADAVEEVEKATKGAAAEQNKLGKSAQKSGTQVSKSFQQAEGRAKRFKKTLSGMSGAMKAFAGGLALGAGAGLASSLTGLLKEAEESATMASRTRNVIESTGGAARVAADEVDALATALSNKSGADDEAIQNGANLMLTFTKVRNEVGKGNDVYTRATSLALDMSTAMGTDMKQSALQLGKALNDPTRGVSALTRTGVSFTQQQKEQIKALQESGDMLGAQKIILGEVQTQFGGAAQAMADPSARLSTIFGNLREQLGSYLLPLAQSFADWMLNTGGPAISGFMDAFASGEGAAGQFRETLSGIWQVLTLLGKAFVAVGGFIMQHRTAFTVLAVAVGGAVAVYKTATMAMAAYSAAMTAYRAVAAAVTVAQTALNLAFLSNPITWVIIGIVALVAALVVLYQKNEAFRNLVNTAWASIKAAIGAVVTWVTGTAVPWLVNAWNWIKNGAVALWTRMVAIWNGIRAVIGAVVGWVMANVVPWLVMAWSWIKNGAIVLWTAMGTIWNGIKAVIGAVVTWIATVAYPIWNRIFNALKTIGMVLWTVMRAIWSGISAAINIAVALIRGDIKGAAAEFQKLWDKGAELRDRLVDAWNTLKDNIGRIAGEIRDGAIEGLKNAFKGLWDWVGTVRDGIVGIWDDMKAKMSEVTDWVKEKAIKPVLNAWNKVAGIVKLPQVDMAGWATGGYTGAGRKYEPAGIVHRDEYVIRKEATNKLRSTVGLSGLDYMNRTGRLPGHADGGLVGGVPGYARGGLAKPWPTYVAGVIRRLFPAVRSIGGYGSRPGPSDHGSGNALDVMVPDSSPLGDAVAAWAVANRAALKLKYVIWKKRIIGANGGWDGWRPYTRYGNSPNRTLQHYDHPHLSFIHDIAGNPDALGVKLSPEEVSAALAGGGGGEMSMPFWFAPFQAILEKVKGGIAAAVGAFGNHPFAQAMGGIPTALIDGLMKFVSEKFGGTGSSGGSDAPYTGPVGKGVEQWRSVVLQALSIMGQPASLANTVLRRMNQESGGNPNAVNNWDSNARRGTPSQGLMQTIAPTYRAYRHPQYDKGMRDPLSNILASMRYALARYGSLAKAYNRKGGYAGGGLVKPTLYDTGGWLGTGTTVVQNNTGKPELVLTQEQLATIGRNGPSIVINGVKMDTVPDVMEAIRFAEARQRSGGRYARMG